VQLQCNSSVCKLMSTGPNPIPVHSVPILLPKDLFLMTFLNSKIRNYFMTRDQGTTHKLKPRLFIKSYSTPTLFFSAGVFSWGFFLIVKYYLFSDVVLYSIPELIPIYYSIPLYFAFLSLTEFTNSHQFLSYFSSYVSPVCSSLFWK